MKTVKITQSCVGINFSYSPGEIVKMPDKEAASFIKHEQAKAHNPEPHEKVIRHPVSVHNLSENSQVGDKKKLPEDCPNYEVLIEAGLTTVDDVLNHDDLTMLKGIGDATAKSIIEFLKSE